MRARQLVVLLFFVLGAFAVFPHRATSAPDPQAAPKPTPEIMARAKKLYGFDCAVCHGPNGDAKGDMSGDYAGKLHDWTNPDALAGFTDQQLFDIIKNGKGDMPPEGKRAKTDELWGLVALVRSFSAK